MQIRSIKSDKEIEQVKELWDYCFEKKDTSFFQWYFSQYCPKQNTVLGAFLENDLAGMLHLNPYTISLNGCKIDTSYIVGVATSPLYRRKGVLKNLLISSFAKMREENQALAILMPSAIGVYMPYGFSFCYQQMRYNLPTTDLINDFPKVEDFVFSFVQVEDYSILKKVYDKAVKDFNGFVVREQSNWENILNEFKAGGGNILVARKDADYVGYMLYFFENNSLKIMELVGLNQEVKKSFLSYASQHFSQCEQVSWQMPINDLTYLDFKTNKNYPKILPFMAARVIEPIKALNDLKIDMFVDETLNIQITDNLLQENNAVFKLMAKNNKAFMQKVDEQPDIKIDIGTLTQLYFSAYKVQDLYTFGKIEVYNNNSLNLLENLFTLKTNYINEYF